MESVSVIAELQNVMNPREYPKFWSLLKKLIVRGEFDSVSQLLDDTVDSDKILLVRIFC